MLRAFCDESYDGEQRVYSVAGYVAKDKEWAKLSRNWKNRNLRDGVSCFHATDCEHGTREFAHLSKQQRIAPKSDLITIVDEREIAGFAIAIFLEDFKTIKESSDKARRLLDGSPYLLCFQFLVGDISARLNDEGINSRVPYMFDQHDELSREAKILYEEVRQKNPSYSPRMGTLRYGDKRRHVPLQVADNLVYETMKLLLNQKYDETRPERIAMTRMKPKIGSIRLFNKQGLEALVVAHPETV